MEAGHCSLCAPSGKICLEDGGFDTDGLAVLYNIKLKQVG